MLISNSGGFVPGPEDKMLLAAVVLESRVRHYPELILSILYENHVSGYEVWQYMGTWLTEGTTWVHQFRHRDYHGKRTYVDITPTDEFLASIPEILAAS